MNETLHPKTHLLEWKYLRLDGQTCERCGDTGATLRRVIADLNDSCCGQTARFELRETPLDESGVDESNRIFLDGRPLEAFLPDARVTSTGCRSCGELLGEPTDCRALVMDGELYEAIPETLIRAAICRAAACCEKEGDCGCETAADCGTKCA